MDVDAGRTKAAGIFMDDSLTLRTNLESLYLKMWELQARLDRDATRAEANVPENATLRQVESLKCQEPDGHLGDHLLATVKQRKLAVGDAEGALVLCGFPAENHAVRHREFTLGSFFKGKRGYLFERRVSQVLADIHGIVLVAIVEHTLCNGGRSMLFVCKNAYLPYPFY